jgi:hypothetical protein
MKRETALLIQEWAGRNKRITAEILPRGRGFMVRATLRSRHIGPRTAKIYSEKQWTSIIQAWKGL